MTETTRERERERGQAPILGSSGLTRFSLSSARMRPPATPLPLMHQATPFTHPLHLSFVDSDTPWGFTVASRTSCLALPLSLSLVVSLTIVSDSLSRSCHSLVVSLSLFHSLLISLVVDLTRSFSQHTSRLSVIPCTSLIRFLSHPAANSLSLFSDSHTD